jgi:phosphate transport system substrate-binding protein
MTRTLFALSILALAAGCSKSDGGAGEAPLPGSKKADAPSAAGGTVTLTGAGATFPYPLYTRWIADYTKLIPGLQINYQSIGSGGGIRQITERTVDFGATDSPMSEEQLAKAPGMLHIPTCLGAVVLIYNLDGVKSGLKITPEAATGIFLGKIKDWDDPLIAKENADVKLPHKAIASVHRSDGSGTTKIFVDYLTAVSPDWKAGPGSGTSVSWPSGLGAKGNEGISGQVASTPGAIGYVELVYAAQNKLSYASMKNAAGKFVMPTLESVTAAGASALAKMPEDLRVSIVNAEGDAAYPISGFTYMLLFKEQKDAVKGKALTSFLAWSLHDGQKLTQALNYAPLPDELVKKADAKLHLVTGPDGKAFLP